MPLFNDYARKKKIDYFLKDIPKDARVLEIGCGGGWVRDYMRKAGWKNYTGMDIVPPADIVADVRKWREAGLEPHSFDVIIAFEVIEHIHCFQEMLDLLKPAGELLVTTPVPHMDWLCRVLESIGFNQKRTSPHDHLIYFKDIPLFEPFESKTQGLIGQWGKFRAKTRSAV